MYSLKFHKLALKEWSKLDNDTKGQFKKKLAERLVNPRVMADALSGLKDHFKIKLRTKGYRLIYKVDEQTVSVLVIAVGKREKKAAYRKAKDRG